MTADPDAIGPDGRVRLRCYLLLADSLICGCDHTAPISIRAAIRFTGSAEAMVGDLERRLRCSQCGGRRVSIVVQPDPRPPAVRESEGLRPETRAGLPD